MYHPENGGPPVRCPLLAAITASNELPAGEDLSAVYDRLLVRLEVGYLADPSSFAALVRSAVTSAAPAQRTTVDLAGLRHAIEHEVPSVAVPDGIVDAVLTAVLWDSTTERPTVEREVVQLGNPDAREALDLADAIDELEAPARCQGRPVPGGLSEWAIKEANRKLSRTGKRLAEIHAEAQAAGRPPPPWTR